MNRYTLFASLIVFVNGYSEESSFRVEGVLGNVEEHIQNMNASAKAFMPYNPVVLEIGAYQGAGTSYLSSDYPYGTIYAFEPDPQAYIGLVENTQSCKNVIPVNLAINRFSGSDYLWGKAPKASLIHRSDCETSIEVDCMTLDAWCTQNRISHVDLLRLDTEGMEWQILQNAPNILKTVSVIVTKSFLNQSNGSVISFRLLKMLLQNQGFELLSHWYQEAKEGEAIFIRKEMYDTIFR